MMDVKQISFFLILFLFNFSEVGAVTLVCRSLNHTVTTTPYKLNNMPGPTPMTSLTLNITRASNATLTSACNGFVAMNAGNNDSPATYYSRRLRRNGTNFINYNYYSTSTMSDTYVLEGCGTTDANKQLTFSIPIGQTSTTVTYYIGLTAPAAGTLANGSYTDTVSTRSYEGSIGSCSLPGGSRNAVVTFMIDSTLDISPVSQTMDLGVLSVGSQATASFTITHNGNGFRLATKTTNGSQLKKTGATAVWNYQTRFKNGAAAYGSFRTVPTDWNYYSEITSNGGTSPVTIQVNVQVVSPEPTGPLAGSYTDTMNFEVSAF